MSNRKKTCAYCGGNHAILDCIKLTKDTETAHHSINRMKTDAVAWKKEAIHAYAKFVFYSRLITKRTESHIERQLENEYSVAYDPARHKVELLAHLVQQIRWRLQSYESPDSQIKWGDFFSDDEISSLDPNIFDTFSTEITGSERWLLRQLPDQYRPQTFLHIIRKNKEVQDAVAKRSRKSCSYCRGVGHTVRTCKQSKIDAKTYHDAFKVSAYLRARACSRFGIWTSSMIKKKDEIYLFQKNNLKDPYFFTDIEGNDKISTEDFTDCLYAMCTLEKTQYRKLKNSESAGYYQGNVRTGFEVSKDYLRFIDLKNSRIDMTQPDDDEALRDMADNFYRTHISTEHIFLQLMEYYTPPKPTKDKYCSSGIGTASIGSDFFTSNERYRSHIWIRGNDLYDRKKREHQTFTKMQRFVDANHSILSKANETLNKS